MAEMALLLDERSHGARPEGATASCARGGCSCRSASRASRSPTPPRSTHGAGRPRRARRPAAALDARPGAADRASSTPTRIPGNIFVLADGTLGLIDFGAVGRLDPIQQSAVVDMHGRRSPGATSSLLRDGVERVAEVADTTSPERARARAGPADGRPRAARRRRRPRRAAGPRRDAVRASACACRPTSWCCRGRWSPSTARCACSRPDLSLVAAATELRRADGRRAGRRPRGDDPRRAAGDAPAPAPAARTDRPHPHADRPRRAAHPQRRRRGQPAHPAHARQPRCCSWSSAPSFLVASALLLVATDAGPAVAGETGLFEVFGYGGLLAGTVLCCGWSPRSPGTGRHDVVAPRPRPRSTRRRPAAAVRRRRPPGERYYRHPGDVVRLVVWAAATIVAGPVHRAGRRHERRASRDDLGGVGRLVPPRRPRARCSRSPRSSPSSSRSSSWSLLVARQRWRRLGCSSLARRRRAPRRSSLDRPALDLAGRLPEAVRPATLAALDAASRRSPTSAAAAAAATVGKPWLSRPWRRAADRRPARARPSRWLVAGTAGVARAAARGGRRRRRRRRRVLVVLRRAEPPADARSGRRRARSDAGFDVAGARRSSGPTAGGPSSTVRRSTTVAGVRQGVRPGQPRRRPAVPRLPHAAAARPERRLAVAVARARRRARGVCCSARPPGRRALPRRSRRCRLAAGRVDGPGDGGRRRPAARRAAPERDRRPTCSTPCGSRSHALHARRHRPPGAARREHPGRRRRAR